jgi:hypothetical protein
MVDWINKTGNIYLNIIFDLIHQTLKLKDLRLKLTNQDLLSITFLWTHTKY